jgi:hypothetical protein
MFKFASDIVVGSYRLAAVVSLELTSSWDLFTDTCKITLPSSFWHRGQFVNLAESRLIKKGDEVSVSLGYDSNLKQEFKGYVAEIQSGSPTTIVCQDSMWLLKQKPVSKSFRAVKLEELLLGITSGINVVAADIALGQFRIKDATPVQVLEEIKKTYGLVSFFKGDTLYSGLPYPVVGATHQFEFGRNIIDQGTELSFVLKEDVRIKVKAVSIRPDNTKIETEIGDENGELRTLTFYNLSLSELKTIAQAEADKLRYDGFRGSFMAFGQPSVQHGDIVEILDSRYNRSGRYIVKSVTKTVGVDSGYRQKIEIDRSK